MAEEFNIHDVAVRQVPIFDARGNAHQVTRVSIYVGDHGPFIEDFGLGQQYADTPEAINTWKQSVVVKLMAVTRA